MDLNPSLVLPQSPQVLYPPTITSAGTINPVSAISFIDASDGNPINVITAPFDGPHQLVLIPVDGAVQFNTGGNVSAAVLIPVSTAGIFSYDPRTQMYYPLAVQSINPTDPEFNNVTIDGTLAVTGITTLDDTAIATDGAGALTAGELHADNGASATLTAITAITVVDGIITSISGT